jgi:hypothetical protein
MPGAATGPTDAPQWWQNLAPGVSGLSHEMQLAPASAAPQFAQNRPVAGFLQRGQGAVDSDVLMPKGKRYQALYGMARPPVFAPHATVARYSMVARG